MQITPEQPGDEEPEDREVSLEVVQPNQQIIVRLPGDFRDVSVLTTIMNEPLSNIAATITGALSLGREDAVLAGGRIVQGALKGRLLKQVGSEINELLKKGKLREDYADSKFGFKSLVELLQFIDDEVPDEDRMRAVRAMFLAINSVDTDSARQVVNYHLFQISKKLSGTQLLTLRAIYRLKDGALKNDRSSSASTWLEVVAREVRHGVTALVEQDETALIANGLISDRTHADRSGIRPVNARLTDLGIEFCHSLVSYESESGGES